MSHRDRQTARFRGQCRLTVDNLLIGSDRTRTGALLLGRRIAVITGLLAVGCGSSRQLSGAISPSQIEVRLIEDVQLLDRTRTVLVRGDGKVIVEYHMKGNGKVTDTATRSIDPGAVEALMNEILDAGFRQMPTEYHGPRTSVLRSRDGRYQELITVTADGTCAELTLTIENWRKTVRECYAAPKPLRNLYERLLTIAGEQRFP